MVRRTDARSARRHTDRAYGGWLLRRDPEGIAIGVIESSADVTEHKRTDAERQRTEQRYKTIFNGASFAMWEADWTELHAHICENVPSGMDLADWLIDHTEILRESLARVCVRDVNTATVSLFAVPAREALLGNITLAISPCARRTLERMYWLWVTGCRSSRS